MAWGRSKHQTRKDLRDLLRRAPGVPAGGSLWKNILGVISPLEETDALEVGTTTFEQIFFSDLLRNVEDGSGDGLGGLFFPSRADTTSFSSNQNDLDLGTGIVHRLQATVAGLSITGIVPPTGSSGTGGSTGCIKVLLSENSDFGFALPHNSSGSAGENRFVTPYARTLNVPPRSGATYSAQGALLYYLGEPSPLPLRWAVFPLGFSPDVVQGTDNGALWITGQNTELMTIAAAASSDSVANLLPANSLIEAVEVRVTVAIPTATLFAVGDPTTATRFIGSFVPVAVDTTSTLMAHMGGSVTTDAAGPTQTAAAKIRITPNATPANSNGRVRVTVFYRTFVPPTS